MKIIRKDKNAEFGPLARGAVFTTDGDTVYMRMVNNTMVDLATGVRQHRIPSDLPVTLLRAELIIG